MKKHLLLVIGLLLSVWANTQTVWDIVESSPDHEVLEELLISSNISEALMLDGPYTLFAPTDEAFDALPADVIEEWENNPAALSDLLFYHTVLSEVLSEDLEDGLTISMLNADETTITIEEDEYFINNAAIIEADLVAENGVVHVIDAVLGIEADVVTLWDLISDSPDHSILETAIIAVEGDEDLSDEDLGPLTLFAPTDAAFDELPEGALDALLADPEGPLTNVLSHHALDGLYLAEDFEDGVSYMTANEDEVTITIDGDDIYVDDVLVTVADLEAVNGVLHVIDVLLLPPADNNSVFGIIEDSPVHETLEGALNQTGLAGPLTNGGPFTVFAPTDAAFELLPADFISNLTAFELATVLQGHVVSGVYLAADLFDGQVLNTLAGSGFERTITIDGADVYVGDALISVVDIEAENGVVHIIDAVLPPPPPVTVMDVIAESVGHNTLEAALISAGLDATLSDESLSLTVFAPTDLAFEQLPEGLLEELLSNPAGDLTDVLNYHVVPALTLYANQLDTGDLLSTLNGENLLIAEDNGFITVNQAFITLADLNAANGVVHVIDAVLLPTSITDGTATESLAALGFSVYPNPSEGLIQIELEDNTANIEVLDINGQLLYTNPTMTNQHQIDLSHFVSGVYLLKININNQTYFHKIVVR